MNLKKVGKLFTSKFVGTGPSSDKKRIYRPAVSQRLRSTALEQAINAQRESRGIALLPLTSALVGVGVVGTWRVNALT